MIVIGQIKKGMYFDSITLMNLSNELTSMKGVTDAAVVMGTKENRAILAASGLLTSAFKEAHDTDLLISIKAENEEITDAMFEIIDKHLEQTKEKKGTSGVYRPGSLETALSIIPDANLALISVAGRYASSEAKKALQRGLHVMIFSDNVSLQEEIKLKKFAREKSLLVMGPDCGTAIINGVPIAFANNINRGSIGLVAAAGTGLQEISCVISNEGSGVSQAIGTGGRDVTAEIGGIMFIEALQALADDEETKVIVLVSKPPDGEVLNQVLKIIESIDKPVISCFLGTAPAGCVTASTLEEAALIAVALVENRNLDEVSKLLATREDKIKQIAKQQVSRRKRAQKYVRGLFSGGTFCTEAQIIFAKMISNVYSNVPVWNSVKLKDSLNSQMNTIIDLGADEFTVGRLHPMIDYSLRKKRILAEAEDPATAVVLLDIVLGYGANQNPASELSTLIQDVSKDVSVICSITGTDQDPQNKKMVEQVLRQAGAIIMSSNAAACKLAGYIIQFRLIGKN